MRGQNICFHGEIRKIIFEFPSIPPIIWSPDKLLKNMDVIQILMRMAAYFVESSLVFHNGDFGKWVT